MRLGAATVVRLEGALAHEVLRRLQGPVRRHDDAGPAPVLGLAVADATAIGKPVEGRDGPAGPARGHGHAKEVADTLGQRYGSPRTRVKPAGPWCRRCPKPPILGGGTTNARRHAGEQEICGRLDCLLRPRACSFRLLRPSTLHAQAVDKRVDNRASFTRARTHQDVRPTGRAPARAETEPAMTTGATALTSGAGGIRWPRQALITRRSGNRRSAPSTRWDCPTRSGRSSGSAVSSGSSTRRHWCGLPTPSPRTSSSSGSASRSTRPSRASSATRSSSRSRSTRASRPTSA